MPSRNVTLTAPASQKAGILHTPYGLVNVTPSGTVSVDSRLVQGLMKLGFTSGTLPDVSDPAKLSTTVSLAVPAGIGEVHGDGRKFPIVSGRVTVPRDMVPSFINEGFTK